MSKYWKNMKIWRKDMKDRRNTEDLFLSIESPNFIDNNANNIYKTLSDQLSNNEDLEIISRFYSINYRIGKSDYTTALSIKNIRDFLYLSSEIVTLYDKNFLAGSMLSIYVPVMIDTDLNNNKINSSRAQTICVDNGVIFGYASYLILHPLYRNKGLGMNIIQKSLQILYDKGDLGAYFVNKVSRCNNSIALKSYIYPLNFDRIDKFSFLKNYSNYKKLFQIQEKNLDFIHRINEENSYDSYNFYKENMHIYKFYFLPNFEYWKKWISVFPTFITKKDGKIDSLFCLNFYQIKNADQEELNASNLLFYVGEMNFENIIGLCKKHSDYLSVYEIGNLTKTVFGKHNFQFHSINYINFYNTNIKMESKDIYLPIF